MMQRLSKDTGISIKELNRLNQDKWYHGTTIEGAQSIQKRGVIANYNLGSELDFGMGFYLTDTYERAENFISRIPVLQDNGILTYPKEWVVLEFEINPFDLIFNKNNNYKYKNFPSHNEEFARFSLENRLYNVYNEKPHGYDIIWGVMSDNIPAKIVADVRLSTISFEDAIAKMQKPSSMKQLYIGNQEICDMLTISNVFTKKEEKKDE